ncbi:hypothetical protein MAPG_10378 [Magnaporthiopsis poae ATCC 64411]|uniref:Uncharacterized protein n=1 Tax=Magnaporthiopsis poae (strain ATCC 64411 / 73-15) TaxID=644358 RepID=A0A0C4ECF4_MAGP6|nr:hypothetical protein MAPG_10378 [Magnaporthiopsis poae ATCC 64411]
MPESTRLFPGDAGRPQYGSRQNRRNSRQQAEAGARQTQLWSFREANTPEDQSFFSHLRQRTVALPNEPPLNTIGRARQLNEHINDEVTRFVLFWNVMNSMVASTPSIPHNGRVRNLLITEGLVGMDGRPAGVLPTRIYFDYLMGILAVVVSHP